MTAHSPHTSFQRAAAVLRLDEVLTLISAHCAGQRAREQILSLMPMTDGAAIADALAEVAEMRVHHAESGDVPVVDVPYTVELSGQVPRGSLDPLVLLDISLGERAASDVHRMLAGRESAYPLLGSIAGTISPDLKLVSAIDATLAPDGSVRDDASPELRRIRRDLAGLRGSLRTLSENLAGGFGAEALTTVIGQRHVLVVPRTKTRRGDGLVHAVSGSGGSLYFEPVRLVEMNNDLETRTADESEEVARILRELTMRVRAAAPRMLINALAVVRLDTIRARSRFAREYRCECNRISDGRVRIVGARHPLLTRALRQGARGGDVVPLDVTIDRDARLLVISGPNAGGKTVALETLGVCALLLQCGVPAPAGAGSELPVFDAIFVDIGDGQSMEDSLSTFTSHLKNLDAMISGATASSLCLIDEIGDGTDPDEGAALAVATLERLRDSGALVVATTHYGRIKTWALETSGVANGSMAFDESTGLPLYRLLLGVAGRSRGLETAGRTGFDARVVAAARELVGGDAFRLETALAELEKQRLAVESERTELAEARALLAAAQKDVDEKAARYNLTRRQAERRALRDAEEVLVEARREAEGAVRIIRERRAEHGAVREARDRIEAKLADVRRRVSETGPVPGAPGRLATVSEGDRVAIHPSGEPAGTVVSCRRGRAVVEIGGKRITISTDRLYPAHTVETPPVPDVTFDVQFEPLTTTTLDVRGQDRESALEALTRFLDQAVLTGVQEITIIHGVGEGVLLRAVRDHLQSDARVREAVPGESSRGGIGVTVARF